MTGLFYGNFCPIFLGKFCPPTQEYRPFFPILNNGKSFVASF